MKTSKWTIVLAVASLFAACQKDVNRTGTALNQGTGSNSSVAGGTTQKTGQSIMVSWSALPAFYQNDQSASYSFISSAARSYYSVSPTSGGSAAALNLAANNDVCIFWNGGALTASQTFTIGHTTYTVTSNRTVDPKTA